MKNEKLTFNGQKVNYNLHDFWQWSVSDILSNATRGRLAEFIVGTAIGLNPEDPRDEWGAYDLTSEEGIRIEIKSAAYIQSWNQKKLSIISFSIKRARYWDAETNMQHKEPKRHADIYVFCLLKHQEQSTIDPLKLEQWEFYVIPTYVLDNYERSQSSITIKSLKKLSEPLDYSKLSAEIQKAYKKQRVYT